MIYLGKVVHLQVQEHSLKVGEGAKQRYDRAGLRVVDELELNDGGVRGFRSNVEIADVHHRDHPLTKLRGTRNAISFGFTGHYDRMRNRFGSHFDPAVAGENILIEHDGRINLADVEKGLVITDCRRSISQPHRSLRRSSLRPFYPLGIAVPGRRQT